MPSVGVFQRVLVDGFSLWAREQELERDCLGGALGLRPRKGGEDPGPGRAVLGGAGSPTDGQGGLCGRAPGGPGGG